MATAKRHFFKKHPMCSEPGCKTFASKHGLCREHYEQPLRDVLAQREPKARIKENCLVAACKRPAKTRRLCQLHYQRWLNHGDPLFIKTLHPKPQRCKETNPSRLARVLGVSRQRAHQILNKQAHVARGAVAYALKTGRLIKPDACERCGVKTSDLEAHHWDYHEELDVRWVCPPCHSIVHPHHPFVKSKNKEAEQAA